MKTLCELITAFLDAQYNHHRAIEDFDAANKGGDLAAIEAAALAAENACNGEDDAIIAICAYRPTDDAARAWRGDFLKNYFRQDGGQEPTVNQMAALIDGPQEARS